MKKLILLVLLVLFLSSCNTIKNKINTKPKIEYFSDGKVKAKGFIDEDYLPVYELKTGEWKEFYSNSKIKSKGNYKIGHYVNCCTGGTCDGYYIYKVGKWFFYYDNGNLMASGNFKMTNKNIKTSCEGGDKIKIGITDKSWTFYDKNGDELNDYDYIKKIIEDGSFEFVY